MCYHRAIVMLSLCYQPVARLLFYAINALLMRYYYAANPPMSLMRSPQYILCMVLHSAPSMHHEFAIIMLSICYNIALPLYAHVQCYQSAIHIKMLSNEYPYATLVSNTRHQHFMVMTRCPTNCDRAAIYLKFYQCATCYQCAITMLSRCYLQTPYCLLM